MILSFISGFISIHIFQTHIIKDAHFMDDLFSCNDWTIHDLYKYNCCVTFPSVYIPSLFYLFMDRYYENANILHLKRIYNPGCKPLYKIPWNSYQRATIRTFFSVYQYVFFHTFIGILFWQWRGICDETYSFWSSNAYFSYIINLCYAVIYVALYGIVGDVIFYSTHRLLHEYPFLYVNIHKVHHEWVHTFGIASSASSFWEHLIVGIPTLTFTPFILKLPIEFAYIMMSIGGISTICGHSGYEGFGPSFGGIPHDYHHHFRECEFGAGGFCDWLFKTRLVDVYPCKDLMLTMRENLDLDSFSVF